MDYDSLVNRPSSLISSHVRDTLIPEITKRHYFWW